MKSAAFYSLFLFVLIVTVPATAGQLTIPNTFTAGSPARASEVNANFNAVKVAVDNNNSRLDSIESFQNSPMKMITNNSGLGIVAYDAWAWSDPLIVTPIRDGILRVIVNVGVPEDTIAYKDGGLYINTTGVAPTNIFTKNFGWNYDYGYNYAFPVLANNTYYIWYGVHNTVNPSIRETNNTFYEIQAIFHSSSGL